MLSLTFSHLCGAQGETARSYSAACASHRESFWRAATFALEDSETLSDATFSAFRFALLWFNLADFGIETTFHALQNLANLQNLASLPNALQSLLVQEPRRSTDTIFIFLWSAVLPFFQQLWISLRKDQERFQCI